MENVKEIKPGHPIWEEVWEKSRPGGITHLEQLFAAKLELAALRSENELLKATLANVQAPVSDEEWYDATGNAGSRLCSKVATYIIRSRTQATQKGSE